MATDILITIDTDNETCGNCPHHKNYDWLKCPVFGYVNLSFDEKTKHRMRCPACLEAEKRAKELKRRAAGG